MKNATKSNFLRDFRLIKEESHPFLCNKLTRLRKYLCTIVKY